MWNILMAEQKPAKDNGNRIVRSAIGGVHLRESWKTLMKWPTHDLTLIYFKFYENKEEKMTFQWGLFLDQLSGWLN